MRTSLLWRFSAPSTFGGVIPTPTLAKVANMGLRYTNFHSTSLCSPTLAAPSVMQDRGSRRNWAKGQKLHLVSQPTYVV